MNSFLAKSLAPPMALASVVAVGFTFVWILASIALLIVVGPWFEAWFAEIRETSVSFGWLMVIYLLSPLCSGIVLFVGVPLNELSGLGAHTNLFEWSQLANFLLPMAFSFSLSLFAAICFYRWHQRYSDRGALAWGVFIFIWGLPGIVGYLLHRSWPPMEQCQHCRRLSPRDRDACLHCQTPFPTPPLKGIEIFS